MRLTTPLSAHPFNINTYQALTRLTSICSCRVELDARAESAVTVVVGGTNCIVVDPDRASILHLLAAGALLRRRQRTHRPRGNESNFSSTRANRWWRSACTEVTTRFRMLGGTHWNEIRDSTNVAVTWGKVKRTPLTIDPTVIGATSDHPLDVPATLSLDDIDWGDQSPIADLLTAIREDRLPLHFLPELPDVGIVRVPMSVPTVGSLHDGTLHRVETMLKRYDSEARNYARCRRDRAESDSGTPIWLRTRSGTRFHATGLHDAVLASRTGLPASPFARQSEPVVSPFDPDSHLSVIAIDLVALSDPNKRTRVSSALLGILLRGNDLLAIPTAVIGITGIRATERNLLELVLRLKESDEPFDTQVWARLGRAFEWDPWVDERSPCQFVPSHFDLLVDIATKEIDKRPNVRSLELMYIGSQDVTPPESLRNGPERTVGWIDQRLEVFDRIDADCSGFAMIDEELKELVDPNSRLGRLVVE